MWNDLVLIGVSAAFGVLGTLEFTYHRRVKAWYCFGDVSQGVFFASVADALRCPENGNPDALVRQWRFADGSLCGLPEPALPARHRGRRLARAGTGR